jgi:cytochrome c oxidase cbb3-type subunit 3
MSLVFLSSRTAAGLALIAAAWLSGGMARGQDTGLPVTENGPNFVATSTLFPGGGVAPAQDPHVTDYEGNSQHIAEGERLFNWYNCSGCHFHGGGGMGPPLMDQQWRYGGRLDQIYASIIQGRPNGMPSWARKIPDAQIWEIAAFVKSLSGPSSAEGPGQTMPSPPPPPPAPPAAPRTAAPGVQAPQQ